MLIPSGKLFYAVEAVLYIAYHAKAEPISGSAIAAAQGLPPRYLEPMLQKLVRAGILRGLRGPQGGYLLGRERRRITLADIHTTLDADTALPTKSTPLGTLVLAPVAERLRQSWREQLTTVTLADLCEQASSAHIASGNDPATDFTI